MISDGISAENTHLHTPQTTLTAPALCESPRVGQRCQRVLHVARLPTRDRAIFWSVTGQRDNLYEAIIKRQ